MIYMMPDLPVRYGPRSISRTTMGLFAPGGFIRYEIDPRTSSLNGFRRWTYVATSTLWSTVKGEGGDDWGDTVYSPTTMNTKPIEIYVDIPNDSALVDKKVTIHLEIQLTYPVSAPGGFTNTGTQIQDTFDLMLDNNQGDPVSGFDRAKCNRCTANDKAAVLGSWLILYPAAWIIAGITAASILSKRTRKREARQLTRIFSRNRRSNGLLPTVCGE